MVFELNIILFSIRIYEYMFITFDPNFIIRSFKEQVTTQSKSIYFFIKMVSPLISTFWIKFSFYPFKLNPMPRELKTLHSIKLTLWPTSCSNTEFTLLNIHFKSTSHQLMYWSGFCLSWEWLELIIKLCNSSWSNQVKHSMFQYQDAIAIDLTTDPLL